MRAGGAPRHPHPTRPASGVAEAAIGAITRRLNVDDEGIREAIFMAAGRPDEETRADIDKVLSKELKEKRLAGVSFRPDPNSLRRAARRKIQTAEGVILVYPGEQENRAVTREQSAAGGWTITIKTAERLVEDGTVPERTRPAVRATWWAPWI
jgi:hypothetical protein